MGEIFKLGPEKWSRASMTPMEKTFVIDYGGQYTHLIARRCREVGVYAEIVPQDTVFSEEMLTGVRGLILSGGPRTVSAADMGEVFRGNMARFEKLGICLLGICFGHQLLAVHLGATLESGQKREYGRTTINVIDRSSILSDFNERQNVWMSHGDDVRHLPDSVTVMATSDAGTVSAFRDSSGRIFGVQFHPEVTHTENGISVIRSFLRSVCGYRDMWQPEDEVDRIVERVRTQVGDGRVLMATSGGVDSTVAAVLIQRAIGDRLFCVFVDNGLLREGEREQVQRAYAQMGFRNFFTVDASEEFLEGLRGVEDPEQKRKIIADTYIRVFERKTRELEEEHGPFDFLGQGTIYPDRVESAATGKSTSVIKSHHNVRLPDWMRLKLVEPLRDLYKDEVRRVGMKIGIPEGIIRRQPFPGPSLAIRIGGPVDSEQLAIVRKADRILQEELARDPVYPRVWQSFCVLLPVRSVGVMGDERTYDQVVVVRIVESIDAMTASVSRPQWETLERVSSRIVNEVKGVNRVVYDLTTKPPGTIEWY